MKRGDVKLLALALLLTLPLTGCQFNMTKETTKALDLNNLDRTVKPGADFYHYAIGHWLKNNPIPAEYSSWGSFNILAEENLHRLRGIMEKAESRQQKTDSRTQEHIVQLVGDFYATGMDEKKVEREGIGPLGKEIERIKGIKDNKSLVEEIARLHRSTADPLFNFFVGADFKNSDLNIAQLYQGGLNLPDRDYYLKSDSETQKIRAAYIIYIAKVFRLLGWSQPEADQAAKTILKIETELAKVSKSKVELRDPRKNYFPMSPARLTSLSPRFDWALYFKTVGLKVPGKLNVSQPEFFKGLSRSIDKFSLAEWQTYLQFCLISGNAGYLSSDFVNANFDFYGKTLNGAKKLMPRWKRVVSAVGGSLDQAVGRLYAAEYFPPKAKHRAVEMVENIRAAFRERIKKLDWMRAGTKAQALKKLDRMTLKIGYPDKWKDYAKLSLKRDSYVLNAIRVNEFEFQRDLAKVGRKVDRTEWHMSPQTVNASYDPQKNDMTFPAGILQPPFFNAAADDAVNYGAIGTVIAHEMTHGFDDEGGKFDAKGDLRDWWSKEDALRFKKKAQGLVSQFAGYQLLPGWPLNGRLTLGENIADLGGVSVSLAALRESRKTKVESSKLIDSLTPEQRFFLSYAQVWRANVRDERAKLLIKVDPHSPPQYRVNGPLSNLPEFYTAFGVGSGEAMFKPENKRVRVW